MNGVSLTEAMDAIRASLPDGWTFDGVVRREFGQFEYAAECTDAEGSTRRFYAESARDAVDACRSYVEAAER